MAILQVGQNTQPGLRALSYLCYRHPRLYTRGWTRASVSLAGRFTVQRTDGYVHGSVAGAYALIDYR